MTAFPAVHEPFLPLHRRLWHNCVTCQKEKLVRESMLDAIGENLLNPRIRPGDVPPVTGKAEKIRPCHQIAPANPMKPQEIVAADLLSPGFSRNLCRNRGVPGEGAK